MVQQRTRALLRRVTAQQRTMPLLRLRTEVMRNLNWANISAKRHKRNASILHNSKLLCQGSGGRAVHAVVAIHASVISSHLNPQSSILVSGQLHRILTRTKYLPLIPHWTRNQTLTACVASGQLASSQLASGQLASGQSVITLI